MVRWKSFQRVRRSSNLSQASSFGEFHSNSWPISSWATTPNKTEKKTSPPDLLVLVFQTRIVCLFGWRLELILDPLMQGRVKRVHAEKYLGTLMIGEPWVSEVRIMTEIIPL
jgi:hypothetical protein